MKFFTTEEFKTNYPNYASVELQENQILMVSEMIYSQIGLRYRSKDWTPETVPEPIKNASMEQLRFMLEHSIPFVDIDHHIRAGEMDADLKSDYSTLALRILANHGYLYRGNLANQNMAITMEF